MPSTVQNVFMATAIVALVDTDIAGCTVEY
jgi:hypothetical protein